MIWHRFWRKRVCMGLGGQDTHYSRPLCPRDFQHKHAVELLFYIWIFSMFYNNSKHFVQFSLITWLHWLSFSTVMILPFPPSWLESWGSLCKSCFSSNFHQCLCLHWRHLVYSPCLPIPILCVSFYCHCYVEFCKNEWSLLLYYLLTSSVIKISIDSDIYFILWVKISYCHLFCC